MSVSSKYFCSFLEKVPRAPIIVGVILTVCNRQSLYFKGQVNISPLSHAPSGIFSGYQMQQGKRRQQCGIRLFSCRSRQCQSGLLCHIFCLGVKNPKNYPFHSLEHSQGNIIIIIIIIILIVIMINITIIN